MTPKEKAIELIEKFCFSYDKDKKINTGYYPQMKQCALIAVEEIIKHAPTQPMGLADNLPQAIIISTSFWLEVKQEIEKL